MRLTFNYPSARHVTVFLDGVEQKHCIEADDVAGIALCKVLADGTPIRREFHRDWQPGEFDYEGDVARWMHGTVELRFDTEDHRTMAEAEQRHYPRIS